LARDHTRLARGNARLTRGDTRLARDNARLTRDDTRLARDGARLARNDTGGLTGDGAADVIDDLTFNLPPRIHRRLGAYRTNQRQRQ
jgi:hypothetical protein